MPPKIRFFRAATGERIAYAVDGEGPWLVVPACWVSHVERDLDCPSFRDFFAQLAEHTTVVRYDRPGVGLSDREHADYSLASEVANLEALVDELGAERVALLGSSCGGPPAIAYAARHRERTTQLVVYGGYACGPRLASAELQAAMIALVRAHWGLGSKTLNELFVPDASREERQQLTAMQREAASAETAAAVLQHIYRMDVSDVAPAVRVPTLVVHRRDDRAIGFEHGREVASLVPGASFAPLTGDAHLMYMGDWAPIADAVLAFVAPRAGEAGRPRDDGNALVREGEVWRVVFGGRRCHVKHARGLLDLATLLAHPGQEIASTQLLEGPEAGASSPGGAARDPVLDERAVAELRARLRELDELVARAEAAGHAAAERAARERDAIRAELRAATGLGGRRRALADPAERARKAVTGRIRETIEKLRPQLPELARHLDASITTGTFCCYAPGTETRWRT